MKRKRNLTVYFAVMTAVILLAACSTPPGSTTEPESDNNAGLANPAAVYCEGLGYTLETVERNGGQDADCVFPTVPPAPSGTSSPGAAASHSATANSRAVCWKKGKAISACAASRMGHSAMKLRSSQANVRRVTPMGTRWGINRFPANIDAKPKNLGLRMA